MKNNITAKTLAVVLVITTLINAIPCYAASRNLDDGIPKRIDSRVAQWLCVNILGGIPDGDIANVGLDNGDNTEPNEIYLFDLIEKGPYKGSYYIYAAGSRENKEMSLNSYGGASCQAGSILKAYVSQAANKDHSTDAASLWWVKEHGDFFTFTNAASGLTIDTYASTTVGDYVRLWYADNSPEQDFILTDVCSELTGTVATSGSSLRLRNSAPSGTTIASMPNGSRLTILDNGSKSSGFYHVRYNGRTGWASAEYIRLSASVQTVPSGTLSNTLYGGNGGSISCGFDGYREYRTNYGWRHEGIDFTNYPGASVYSLIDGTITNVIKGSSSTLSTLAIYDEAEGKTVIYLHLAPASGFSIGDHVSVGTFLGTEAARGAAGVYHTHVEVREGRQTKACVSKDKTLVNSDPTPYWNGKGYSVE